MYSDVLLQLVLRFETFFIKKIMKKLQNSPLKKNAPSCKNSLKKNHWSSLLNIIILTQYETKFHKSFFIEELDFEK
jgi:hypothetical protein